MSNLINANCAIKEIEPQSDTTKSTHLFHNGLSSQFKGTPENDTFESSRNKNSRKAVWITLLSLTGLTALALGLLARKGGKTLGKDAKLGKKIEQGWKKFWGKGEKAVEETKENSKPKKNDKEPYPHDNYLTIDAYKKNGNTFDRGIAKYANGENYTGHIVIETKNAKIYVRYYENGILKEMKVSDKLTGENLYKNLYYYDKNGHLLEVKKQASEYSIVPIFERKNYYNSDKSILLIRSDGLGKGYEFINGKRILRVEESIADDSTHIVTFYRNNGTKEFAFMNCNLENGSMCNWYGTIEIYDDNGNIHETLKHMYENPEKYSKCKDIYNKWLIRSAM